MSITTAMPRILCGDLPLGFGPCRGGALLGGSLGRVPPGFLMADTLDIEFRREEVEDHAHGRDRDGSVARARQRHPQEDRDGADQHNPGEAELGEGQLPQLFGY
jgi:hypothetical protein